MSPRVLVLSAGFGEGHNAAARALTAAFAAEAGAGTAEMRDVFAAAAPRLNRLLRSSYLALITRSPGAWRATYDWLDRSPLPPKTMRLLRGELRTLGTWLERERPAALCSTYPVYAYLLGILARRGLVVPPHFTVVTDSISINSLWWRGGSDGWFVPNEDSAAILRVAPIPAGRVHVLGFPVNGFFSASAGRLAPPDLGQGAAPRVLYIINSGTAAAAEMGRRLLRETNWEVTCTVGRNRRLQDELERLAVARPAPARILGWTTEIPELLMTHHVVISKAGGATTQEALAARCPMIVNQIVPGQEQGNYELLRRHGIGELAETPTALLGVLERAFANRGRVWRQWRDSLEPLSRPDAARDIARHILASVAEPIPLPMQESAKSRTSVRQEAASA